MNKEDGLGKERIIVGGGSGPYPNLTFYVCRPRPIDDDTDGGRVPPEGTDGGPLGVVGEGRKRRCSVCTTRARE